MTALSSARRRRTALMLAANLLVLVAVGGLLYAGAKALSRYEGAKNTSTPTVKVPVTPVGMLASVDSLNRLTSITVFVLKPNGEPGGSIVSIPVSSDTAAGLDGQRIPFTEVYQAGGVDALTKSVEGTLSITLDQALVAQPDQLAAILQPVAPIPVNLPVDVKNTQNSATTTLFSAGSVSLSGKQAASVLNAHTTGQKEASRRATIEALWQGVATAIGDGRTASLTTATSVVGAAPTSLEQLITQIYAGPTGSRGLPIRSLPAADIPKGKDVDELDRAETVMVFATIAPSAMSAAAPGLMFRIEAPPGPGYDQRVKYTVQALLYLGANVQQVYLNGPVNDKTVVILYDQRFANDAIGAEAIFGQVESAEPTERIEGIDVVLQLGSDFLSDTSSPTTMPSTTTTTTEP